MKCPRCGHWNQPSFPRCFQCGEPLHLSNQREPSWQEKFSRPQPEKVRIIYDDSGDPADNRPAPEAPRKPAPTRAKPHEETLAEEMNRLKERRERGSEYLKELRKNAADEGIAPSGTGVRIRRSGGFFSELPDDPEETVYRPEEIRGRLRGNASAPQASRAQEGPYEQDAPEEEAFFEAGVGEDDFEEDLPPAPGEDAPLAPQGRNRRRRRHVRGPMVAAIWVVRSLVVLALAFIGWQGYLLVQGWTGAQPAVSTAELDVTIEACDVDGLPGHTIRIAGEEGSKFYIPELGKSYVVVGGVATITVADYVFYDDIENLEMSQMTATLSPTMSRQGVETRLEPITYTIDIPLSPVQLISPETDWVQVSTSIYTLRLLVEPGSRVTINGEDVSDYVDDDGNLTANPPVQAIGDNIIGITVRAPHCRENNLTVTLYREPQEIPLELNPDTTVSSSEEDVTIHATTLPGATVTMESPYFYINDENLATTGQFSVSTKMTRVGYNTIRIRVSYPGKADSVLEHVVYYLPPASVYTVKAWSLTPADYTDLLNNIALRAENAQIYECKGTILEILSQKPQLAIMDTGTDGNEQLVLLQNETQTTWEVGQAYRVYADAMGMYNTMPRLIGRYTYGLD